MSENSQANMAKMVICGIHLVGMLLITILAVINQQPWIAAIALLLCLLGMMTNPEAMTSLQRYRKHLPRMGGDAADKAEK